MRTEPYFKNGLARQNWTAANRAIADATRLSQVGLKAAKAASGVRAVEAGKLNGANLNAFALGATKFSSGSLGVGSRISKIGGVSKLNTAAVGATKSPFSMNQPIRGLGKSAVRLDPFVGNGRLLQDASEKLKPIQQARILKGVRDWAGAKPEVPKGFVMQPLFVEGSEQASLLNYLLNRQRGQSRQRGAGIPKARLWLRKWARVGLRALVSGIGTARDPATAIVRPPPTLFTRFRLRESSGARRHGLLERLADVIMPNAPTELARHPIPGGGLPLGVI
jgi:hypothetical protein